MARFTPNDSRKRTGDLPGPDTTVAKWNTTRQGTGSSLSYTARTTLSFALTAVMTVALLVVVLAVVWEQQFSRYARANMESKANVVADQLASEYDARLGWDDEALAHAASLAGSPADVGLQVYDASGKLVYDESEEVPGPAPTGAESAVTARIVLEGGQAVGMVRLWAVGSDALLTRSDASFRISSYRAILIAALFAIALATVVGAIVARSLSRPIKRITSTASAIRSGDLTARSGVRGADEIGQLGETFDDMATSLERDLKLEHRLTSDVAHELRTPLMAMLATVEAMQDGVLPADEERLAVVGSEVRRLSRLVDAMLQLSRMENGTASFNPAPCDVLGLVRDLVASQEQLFADNELELTFLAGATEETEEGETGMLFAEVDHDMLNQAVTNLLSNALRYTPAGGSVDVVVQEEGADVLISVSDTGIGIEPEDLSRVFSRFWRSEASRERASGGLGVGLSLTKHIVDRHHGYITVESEVGKGTTFMLHIPKEYRSRQTRRRSSATMGD